ncbi:DNA polymerase III subunit chi [Pelagovum pacificum]|uniref:DNA polymerase III subunit chi n=1 Tax=Pelagovum pacificum TaxID=2588711 RepID=A0A5C5GAI8_9RHOB|nr:DNA polymerase III subunit chi [Pelagovum pacificum]QQA41385.1 DNA polymerase III subunit chi [Pelagovum pacificum]TNY31812.1 DNA polymerase III subunit chi [Pelagovum pacificum]
MGAAFFYHLTRDPVERTLATLLEKCLATGWRCEVRGEDAAQLDRLDAQLWLQPEESFLPHGRAGGPHDADQPVLLRTPGAGPAPNGAQCVLSIGGAEVGDAEVKALERVCILFDGADEAALQIARGQWSRLVEAGCAAQYWSQDSGRWEKKAERGA